MQIPNHSNLEELKLPNLFLEDINFFKSEVSTKDKNENDCYLKFSNNNKYIVN